jgi:uncharacterized membrane protein YuzA (DUF378 family)
MNKEKETNRPSLPKRRPTEEKLKDPNSNGRLESSLKRLQRMTAKLRFSGIAVAFLTFLNIGLVFFFIFKIGTFLFGDELTAANKTVVAIVGLSALLCLGVVLVFESLRKRGDVLFE